MIELSSFNCHSVRKNEVKVRELLQRNDILLLQELMLYREDISYLDTLHGEFNFIFDVQSINNNDIICGRPSRGVAIFWRKCLDSFITPVKIDDRVIGINIDEPGKRILVLNVYMPCDKGDLDSLEEYRSYIAVLQSIIDDAVFDHFILVGDVNADPKKGRFWNELLSFICQNNIYHKTSELKDDTFSYLCPASSSTSMLDHIFCDQSSRSNISNVHVLYNFSLFDHFPISFALNVDLKYDRLPESNDSLTETFIDWSRVNVKQTQEYQENLNDLIEFTGIMDCDALFCTDKICKNCHTSLDDIFNLIVFIILTASSFLCKSNNRCFKQIVGWNDYVKVSYKLAREKFILWKKNGKPKHGIFHYEMIHSRKIFKQKFKFCKNNQREIKDKKLAHSLCNKDSKLFWKQIRKRKSNKLKINNCRIDGETNSEEIAEKFSSYFKSIFAETKILNDNHLNDLLNTQFDSNSFSKFSLECIKYKIKNLNQYCDIDGINSEHLKRASEKMLTLLKYFINSCFIHNYIPILITRGFIEPLLKDKMADSSVVENYRPIIKSSLFLKIFEMLIYDRMKDYFKVNPNQHGFRKHHSTFTACFNLKEVVLSHFKSNTPVYAAFMDISKAFDKVNYSILFSKLLKLNIPLVYIKILFSIYSNQIVQIKYNGAYSSRWKLLNGVRQGGILSPFLFSIYINELVNEISKYKVGCKYGILYNNIIIYADDIVLLAPSLGSLQLLVNKCQMECRKLLLKFNTTKSVCMKFHKINILTSTFKPEIKLENNVLNFVDKVKYLGFLLNFNLKEDDDISRERNKFYASFNTILRKFYSVDFNVFFYLFKVHCLQFYGAGLWLIKNYKKNTLKQFSVGYHKAIKKTLNVPFYYGNHLVCKIVNLVTLEHQLDIEKVRLIRGIFIKPPDILKINYE